VPTYEENPVGVEHDKMSLFFSRFFFDNLIIIFPATIITKIVAGDFIGEKKIILFLIKQE